MSAKKPVPLVPPNPLPGRSPCPVCGEISYSVGGIHPQCSVRQADAERMNRVKRAAQKRAPEKSASTAASWLRTCPKCKALQHVRKKLCQCGHAFIARVVPPK